MEKYLMIDTETANGLDDPFYYDLGLAVVDEVGQIYETASFINADIFLDEDMMNTAYYREKMPHYWDGIKNGERTLAKHATIRKAVREIIAKYDIKYVVAHNASFDYRSTNYTQRLLTSSKYRYFFPFGTVILDTLKMARATFKDDEPYINFCKKNGFVTKRGLPQFTAEVLYRFITQDTDFIESHTGLEDVMIEAKIFWYCRKRNPNEKGRLWE